MMLVRRLMMFPLLRLSIGGRTDGVGASLAVVKGSDEEGCVESVVHRRLPPTNATRRPRHSLPVTVDACPPLSTPTAEGGTGESPGHGGGFGAVEQDLGGEGAEWETERGL